MTPLVSWTLSLLTLLAAREHVEARATHELAAGIVAGAEAEPVFAGPDGVRRTVALDVALAMFESTFRTNAVGDHGHSHGLYAVWRDDVPADVEGQTRQANRMMRESFHACRARPLEERLAFYASGPHGCESAAGQRASRHRIGLAMRLLRVRDEPRELQSANAPVRALHQVIRTGIE